MGWYDGSFTSECVFGLARRKFGRVLRERMNVFKVRERMNVYEVVLGVRC